MIGADGAQYGPVTLSQFRGWISEGRVVANTKVMRSDTQSWLPAWGYAELDLAPAPPVAPAIPQPISSARAVPVAGYDPAQVGQLIRGASWFYWIAALSIVNIGLMLGNAGIRLIFGELGLGTLALVTAIKAGAGLYVGIAADVIVSGIFALFGVFARKAQPWAFIAGGILYVVDAVFVALDNDWLSLAFHAYVLFRIFMGLQANLKLKAATR
jgi:hypothetical protein